jgi:hypothetical protein
MCQLLAHGENTSIPGAMDREQISPAAQNEPNYGYRLAVPSVKY